MPLCDSNKKKKTSSQNEDFIRNHTQNTMGYILFTYCKLSTAQLKNHLALGAVAARTGVGGGGHKNKTQVMLAPWAETPRTTTPPSKPLYVVGKKNTKHHRHIGSKISKPPTRPLYVVLKNHKSNIIRLEGRQPVPQQRDNHPRTSPTHPTNQRGRSTTRDIFYRRQRSCGRGLQIAEPAVHPVQDGLALV